MNDDRMNNRKALALALNAFRTSLVAAGACCRQRQEGRQPTCLTATATARYIYLLDRSQARPAGYSACSCCVMMVTSSLALGRREGVAPQHCCARVLGASGRAAAPAGRWSRWGKGQAASGPDARRQERRPGVRSGGQAAVLRGWACLCGDRTCTRRGQGGWSAPAMRPCLDLQVQQTRMCLPVRGRDVVTERGPGALVHHPRDLVRVHLRKRPGAAGQEVPAQNACTRTRTRTRTRTATQQSIGPSGVMPWPRHKWGVGSQQYSRTCRMILWHSCS